MNDKVFLDSNIFVYSFDEIDSKKREVADHLIKKGLLDGSAVISFQVVQEFLNVATRKFPHLLAHNDAIRYLTTTLTPLWKVSPNSELYQTALSLQARYQYTFYDSLIIAAALVADCKVLYSEDMQHGQRIEKLMIKNPFAKMSDTLC